MYLKHHLYFHKRIVHFLPNLEQGNLLGHSLSASIAFQKKKRHFTGLGDVIFYMRFYPDMSVALGRKHAGFKLVKQNLY